MAGNKNIYKKGKFNVTTLILILSIAILVIFVAFPVLLILVNALFGTDGFNIKDIKLILTDPQTYKALLNSLIIASGTTLFSTIIGTFFAWLVTRTDLPLKKLMKSLFLVPFMFPSFIGALAWKMLLNPRSGYINQFFMNVLGFDKPVFNVYSYLGMMLVETMYLFPFVFIQVSGALERMDPTLEESARISGAGLFTITRRITLPLVLPSVISGALLIMLYSMAHFGTVAVLGVRNGIYNIPTLIYEKINASGGSFASIRTGTILASILIIVAALILWLQNKVVSGGKYQIISGKSFRPIEMKLRGLRWPLFIFCVVYILFTIVLPTVIIFLVGGLKTFGLPFTSENLSLGNYKYVLFEWEMTKDSIFNSVVLGFTAAVITMFAGIIISYVLVKMKVRGKGILQFLGMLPFSVPGSVIALGVILAWSGKFGVNIYNTVWIILVAYIARYMAFSLKSNSAALSQIHDSLIEAARASGATMGRALLDIVLPLARPGMISAFFLIFLPSLRELTVSVMLYSPATRTLGVAIYSLNEDGDTVRAAALAGIALIIIVIGQAFIKMVLERKRPTS
jgi:iron(III) transport system permease protein